MTEKKITKNNPRSVGVFDEKTYKKTTSGFSLKAEARELARCSELSLNTEHVFPVKILTYNELENSLTTGFVKGKDLFNVIWNSTSCIRRIKNIKGKNIALPKIYELGAWLAKYHTSEHHHPDKAEQVAEWLTASFIKKLKLARDQKLLSQKIIEQIEKKFVSEIQNIKKEDYCQENKIQICRVHGDFVAYNMLLDGDDIHILDFADTRIGSSTEDIARFYQNIWAISHTSTYRKKLLLNVAGNFIEAYGLPRDIVDTPYFKSIMAYNSIIHLVSGHAMRHLVSLPTRMELKRITNEGLKWVRREIS